MSELLLYAALIAFAYWRLVARPRQRERLTATKQTLAADWEAMWLMRKHAVESEWKHSNASPYLVAFYNQRVYEYNLRAWKHNCEVERFYHPVRVLLKGYSEKRPVKPT